MGNDRAEVSKLQAEHHTLHERIRALEETNRRLNRRCQLAEAGIAEKVRSAGPSLGRALANAQAQRLEQRIAELEAALRSVGEEVCHIHGLQRDPCPKCESRDMAQLDRADEAREAQEQADD